MLNFFGKDYNVIIKKLVFIKEYLNRNIYMGKRWMLD